MTQHRSAEVGTATAPKGALRTATEEQAVHEYLPLADGIARQMGQHGPDLEDLIQVARLALVKAARRFDPRLNSNFVAFARPTITGELKRYLRDHSWVIQPPREVQELQIEIRREHPLLCQVLGREPRLDELAAHLGQPIPRVAEAVVSQSGRHPDSLDAVHNGRTLEEQLPDACNDEFAALDDSLMLSGALRQLDPDEKLMLRLRYFEDESQQLIGERMRMSQVQVSRALARILQKLQRHILAQFPHTAGERGTPARQHRPRVA